MDGFFEENEVRFQGKNMKRAARRKKNFAKAVRKYGIDRAISESPMYKNLHQYSKNKIHCSCPLCAFNAKVHGRVVFPQKTASDMRKDESCRQQEEEFNVLTAEDFLDMELEDDATETGGISYMGETLENFLLETEIPFTTPLNEVNRALRKCGIRPVA